MAPDTDVSELRLWSDMEVYGHLVGSPAFKAGGTGDPRPAGSIPVHLRHIRRRRDRGPGEHTRLPGMKKLILLVMLVALGVVAARKVRSS